MSSRLRGGIPIILASLHAAVAVCVLARSVMPQGIYRLEKNMPSVYLQYEHTENRQTRCTGESGRHVVLQLHNNTSTSINVGANFSADLEATYVEISKTPAGIPMSYLKPGSEVELCYDVESIFTKKSYEVPDRKPVPKRQNPYCSCSYRSNGKTVERLFEVGFWIRSGESIKFSVPERFLAKYYKVYTTFNYPWEFEGERLGVNEPQHHVYFYYFDLPGYER